MTPAVNFIDTDYKLLSNNFNVVCFILIFD